MDIQISRERGRFLVTILQITGAIDSSNYDELDQAASRAIDAGARHILLDLSGVHFMSSAALRTLQKMDKKLNAISDGLNTGQLQQGVLDGTYRSPYLKLLAPPPPVLLTLKTAGWDMVFDIFKDRKQAINSF